ncbi:MAG TPA: phytoene/squalene synthase family protein [Verrucomicrobiae bacterium]|nr:phytoene/squalene synthase family protein [Verrucomicrobiae bacterium]
MAYAHDQLLTNLLRDVSRSFYRTLRVLPPAIRPQISLAYLLARTTDTIADTELIPLDRRLGALRTLRERILGLSEAPLQFGELALQQSSRAERELLEQCEFSVGLLNTLSPADLRRVLEVLNTITRGQELDLLRFAGASAEGILALRTAAELDDYTYRVAGCVGEFWTRLCCAHVFTPNEANETAMLTDGARFGKGLQLINVLRDLPADLRQGRCYLPAEELTVAGLKPDDLLAASNEPKLRPVYNRWVEMADAHLAAGWKYTNAVPRRCFRVRLACAWPLLIGRKTLQLLRTQNVLDPRRRLKISRWAVRAIIGRSVLYYPWAGAWERLFG